jgi:hypothetical protein
MGRSGTALSYHRLVGDAIPVAHPSSFVWWRPRARVIPLRPALFPRIWQGLRTKSPTDPRVFYRRMSYNVYPARGALLSGRGPRVKSLA